MPRESEFTLPRPDCPHPEYWLAPGPSSTELEVSRLVGAFVRALKPELAIETGTGFGQTAELIGQALARNGRGRLVSLEVDPERVESSRQRCAGLPVEVLQMPSLEYVPDQGIDFLWIDSLEELRPAEISRFAAWATPRCVIGIHDTGPHKELRKMIAKLVDDGLLTSPLYLPTPRGVCFCRYRDGIG
ncbi:MAG TPA: class I SAM-dependent methyltransferase [Thermoanaerobaculia bacterium]|jgi:hypothetical protein